MDFYADDIVRYHIWSVKKWPYAICDSVIGHWSLVIFGVSKCLQMLSMWVSIMWFTHMLWLFLVFFFFSSSWAPKNRASSLNDKECEERWRQMHTSKMLSQEQAQNKNNHPHLEVFNSLLFNVITSVTAWLNIFWKIAA